MLGLLFEKLEAVLLALWGVLLAVFYINSRRQSRARTRRVRQKYEDMERIAESIASYGNDPNAARAFLEQYSKANGETDGD